MQSTQKNVSARVASVLVDTPISESCAWVVPPVLSARFRNVATPDGTARASGLGAAGVA